VITETPKGALCSSWERTGKMMMNDDDLFNDAVNISCHTVQGGGLINQLLIEIM
jgi:hypothetical protein